MSDDLLNISLHDLSVKEFRVSFERLEFELVIEIEVGVSELKILFQNLSELSFGKINILSGKEIENLEVYSCNITEEGENKLVKLVFLVPHGASWNIDFACKNYKMYYL